ncbi:hypothetical protein FRC09_016255, partial [Ceratobasidium sp. 395]
KRMYNTAMQGKPIPTKHRVEAEGGVEVAAPAADPVPLMAEQIKTQSEELAKVSTASRQSFQKTVKTRARKRPNLTGDNQKYLAPEYHLVLTIGAQSEDDYEVESVNGHAPRKTKRIVSREWWFALQELIDCKAAIKAVPDPRAQSKKVGTVIVCGDARPGSPRPNKTVENQLCCWMIKEEALNSHPEWIKSGRVLENDATEASAGTRKCKASAMVDATSVAGPSNKGKQARRKLAESQKALRNEMDDNAGAAP